MLPTEPLIESRVRSEPVCTYMHPLCIAFTYWRGGEDEGRVVLRHHWSSAEGPAALSDGLPPINQRHGSFQAAAHDDEDTLEVTHLPMLL